MKPYYVTIMYLFLCECWIVFLAVHNGRKWLCCCFLWYEHRLSSVGYEC